MSKAVHKHFPALDGLRGIAIILILLNHHFSWVPIIKNTCWVGVDLFFVISGFLITRILLNTRSDNYFFRNFYVKRSFRIFPAYYLTLGIFLIAIANLQLFKIQWDYYFSHLWHLIFYFQNWLYILNPIPEPQMIFFHFWSLAIEEQFYIVFPLLVWLLKTPGKIFTLLLCILTASILYRAAIIYYLQPNTEQFLARYMTRVDGICVGALLAIINCSKQGVDIKHSLAKVFLPFLLAHVLLFLVIKISHSSFPHFAVMGYTTISILFGILLMLAIREKGSVFKTLNQSLLKFFGKISYGLYLIHFPIIVIITYYAGSIPLVEKLNSILGLAGFSTLTALFAIGVSYLSHKYFEVPILKKRIHFLK